jgi:hypothetical protein
MSGCSSDSSIRRRYVRTATDDPPSISEDCRSEGYLDRLVVMLNKGDHSDSQQLLQEDDMKMFKKGLLDLCGLAVI